MMIKKHLLSDELSLGLSQRPIYKLRFRMPGETLTLDDLERFARRARSLQVSIYREILMQAASESSEIRNLLEKVPISLPRYPSEKEERVFLQQKIAFIDGNADSVIKNLSRRVPSVLPIVEFRKGSFEITTILTENLPAILAFLMSSTAFNESNMGKSLNRILSKKIKRDLILSAVRHVLSRTRLRVQHNNGEETLVEIHAKTVEIELEQ